MKTVQTVKVGVIGAGRWGSEHLYGYTGLPNVEVVAVADSSPERAEQAAKSFGIPRWYTRYEELRKLEEVQAISIVTPESDHLRPVLAAAKAGKHILVEKPMAESVAEVMSMIEAARATGVILMPGHICRFEIRYAIVKEQLEHGELGGVVSIQARRNRTKENRRLYARAHPMFAAGIHDVDLLLWYANSPVKRVRGYHRNIMGNATPDVFWGMVEFENGILGSLECNWLTPDDAGVANDDLLQVITDRGIARVDFVNCGFALWKETGGRNTRQLLCAADPRPFGGCAGGGTGLLYIARGFRATAAGGHGARRTGIGPRRQGAGGISRKRAGRGAGTRWRCRDSIMGNFLSWSRPTHRLDPPLRRRGSLVYC